MRPIPHWFNSQMAIGLLWLQPLRMRPAMMPCAFWTRLLSGRSRWTSRRKIFAPIGAARSCCSSRPCVARRPTAVRIPLVYSRTVPREKTLCRCGGSRLLLYALGLAVPIFFQLVIDKVLVHESFTTLYVLRLVSRLLSYSMRSSPFCGAFCCSTRQTRSISASRPRPSATSLACRLAFSSTSRLACSSSTCNRRLGFGNSDRSTYF